MLPLYEDKSEENQNYLETVAEFIHTLINSPALKAEIMKSMRKNIKDIYDGNVSSILYSGLLQMLQDHSQPLEDHH